jgi:hypothetical protein
MRWEGHYRIFSGEAWAKETTWKPRRKWEGNIKMDLLGVECKGMNWIDLAQDRDRRWALVNAVMKHRVP